MCGIAGNYPTGFRGPFQYNSEAVRDSLKHRGPDDSGVFQCRESGISLVHTRLSIQDLSGFGHQPMSSPDHKIWLVFNGEIYNFKAIKRDLEMQGVVFVGDSDSEVILSLYFNFFGCSSAVLDNASLSRFLRNFEGIFAFAIWDQARQLMFLARDSFGVKPLYFLDDQLGFTFSSELKSLPLNKHNMELDPGSIDRYLTFLWNPGSGSPFRHVKKLEPGTAILVEKGRVTEKFSWYKLPFLNASSISKALPSGDELISKTAFLLRQAVHRQLVSDVPVGAFLSGGLDSSSIVAFAKETNPDIRCFTIDVGGIQGEVFSADLPYARQVARYLDVALDVVRVDAHTMASGLEEMVWQLDEPLADPASLNVLYISQLARKNGIKVLLSGSGGDDLFSGYRRHFALSSERFWSWLPRSLRIALRHGSSQLPVGNPLGRRLRKAFSGAHLEGDARLVNYFRWIEHADLDALYTPAFKSALGHARAEDPLLEFLADIPSNASPLERMLALEQRFFLTDHNLTYTDKMSMAVGLEVRVPFLDSDLVEYAAQIPPHLKQRGREGKWILKKAMEPYLPKEVIYRPKSGFGAPLRRWLQVELRDWLSDTLSVDRLQRRGLFDPRAVQRLIADNAEGRIDASYTLLSLACIEIWCKNFLDGEHSFHLNSQLTDS